MQLSRKTLKRPSTFHDQTLASGMDGAKVKAIIRGRELDVDAAASDLTRLFYCTS
jgi:hypothetical protein